MDTILSPLRFNSYFSRIEQKHKGTNEPNRVHGEPFATLPIYSEPRHSFSSNVLREVIFNSGLQVHHAQHSHKTLTFGTTLFLAKSVPYYGLGSYLNISN